MDLRFAYLPDTAPRGIRSPSKTTAGTCFAGSFSGQTRMTSMMLLVMPQRMSRIAGCLSIRTKYKHHSTPAHCNQKGHPTCKREAQDTNHSITLRPPRIEADPYPKKIRSTRARDGILPYLEWV